MQENGNILTGLSQLNATSSNLTFPITHGLHGGMVDTQIEINEFREEKGANRCQVNDP